MSRIQTRSIALLGALAVSVASLGAVSPAMADVPEAHTQVRVSYNDLNLQSAEGHRTLNRRISAAASRACADVDNPGHIAFNQCYDQARTKAHQQLADAGIPSF